MKNIWKVLMVFLLLLNITTSSILIYDLTHKQPTYLYNVASADASEYEKTHSQFLSDNISDDVEINKALSLNKKVTLSSGTFYITNTVRMAKDQILVGQGATNTVLHVNNKAVSTLVAVNIGGKHGYSGGIRDLRLDGIGSVNSTSLSVYKVSNFDISNLFSDGFYIGVDIDVDSHLANIYNSHITGFQNAVLVGKSGSANDVNIIGTWLYKRSRVDGDTLKVVNGSVNTNGVYFELATNSSAINFVNLIGSRSSITNSQFEGSTTDVENCITVSGMWNVISGNRMEGFKHKAIIFNNSGNRAVSNFIHSADIGIEVNAERNIVNDNYILSTSNYGIALNALRNIANSNLLYETLGISNKYPQSNTTYGNSVIKVR